MTINLLFLLDFFVNEEVFFRYNDKRVNLVKGKNV